MCNLLPNKLALNLKDRSHSGEGQSLHAVILKNVKYVSGVGNYSQFIPAQQEESWAESTKVLFLSQDGQRGKVRS